MKNKKLISLLLSLAIIISIVPPSLAANTDYATRGEVVSMLIDASDFYNPTVKRADIIRGDENGNLNEAAFVTRAEALVMLSRAFGELPAPTGDSLRLGNASATFTDLPEWAVAELDNVFHSGIVAGTGDGKFMPSSNITTEQMQLFIRRVWALQGTNTNDDFYATINKTWLNTSKLPAGEAASSTFSVLRRDGDEAMRQIILDTTKSQNGDGSKEQKIADLYKSIIDVSGRNATGLAPLTPYLRQIESTSNIRELMDVRNKIFDELGLSTNIAVSLMPNLKDSTKYSLTMSLASPSLSKEQYLYDDEGNAAYRKMISKFLQLTGESQTEAGRHALEIFQFEKDLSAVSLNPADFNNADKINNSMTVAQIQAMLPAIDVAKLIQDDGFALSDDITIVDLAVFKACANKFNDSNIDLQKLLAKFTLVSSFAPMLSLDATEISNEYLETAYGTAPVETISETASSLVSQLLPDYVGQIFISQNFSAAAKADVTDMVLDFISVYKQRLNNLDWMSSTTKAAAIKKLDSLDMKIGYPDKWNNAMDDLTIKSPENGGSYFQNIVGMLRLNNTLLSEMQFQPVDKSEWITPVYTVNAFYNPQTNDITFPAGILQAPFYDKSASREENLGGIGFIIAHEITHAFDNNGAKFDGDGNVANWWQASDLEAFSKKCDEAVAYYDNLEVAPGFNNNGTQTLSENIADLGAMACLLDSAKKLDAPDYKKLFESLAKCWAMTSTKQYLKMLADSDVHSFNKIRTNRVLANFEQFYTTYNITEKDGMYVPPEKRVNIW